MESSLTWKIGICSGKAVAGVIGNTKYTYVGSGGAAKLMHLPCFLRD